MPSFLRNENESPPDGAPEQQALFEREHGDPFAEQESADSRPRLFTIGHSTRPLEELISALRRYRIERLVDIRHFPSSRHNPQFNKGLLEKETSRHGIEYIWLKKLGGYREGGYLSYMRTPDFTAGIEELERLAREKTTACMCAEVKWFQCHRRRVADVFAEIGWSVVHIFDEKRAELHHSRNNRIKCD